MAKATAIGALAILLWASLALLTAWSRGLPPFELLFLAFSVAFAIGMIVLAARGRAGLAELLQPPAPWLTAFAAIFLYHALYFCALAWAPPAQASLINYLWPLFIVLLSALPHVRAPRIWIPSVIGAALGFAGTILILRGGMSAGVSSGAWLGYLAALGCACVWSAYSVFNVRFKSTPSGMLVGVCGAVALAGFLAHAALESWVTPSLSQYLAVTVIGAGPTGLAFLAWDHATKHGRVDYLGVLSYLAPLISTALLVLTREAVFTPALGGAAILIIAGAALPKLVGHIAQVRRIGVV